MTQDDLAAALNIEQREISLMENERANPAVIVFDAIATALGFGIADLFAPPTDLLTPTGKRRRSAH